MTTIHTQPPAHCITQTAQKQVLAWLHTYHQRRRFINQTGLILECCWFVSVTPWLASLVSVIWLTDHLASWVITAFIFLFFAVMQGFRWYHLVRQHHACIPNDPAWKAHLPSADRELLSLGIELARQLHAIHGLQNKFIDHLCQRAGNQLAHYNIKRLLPTHGLVFRSTLLFLSVFITAYLYWITPPWLLPLIPFQSSPSNNTANISNVDRTLILHPPHLIESVNSDSTLPLTIEVNVPVDEVIDNLQLAISINDQPLWFTQLPLTRMVNTSGAKQLHHTLSLSEIKLKPGDQLALSARMHTRSAITSRWVESLPRVFHIEPTYQPRSATTAKAQSSSPTLNPPSGPKPFADGSPSPDGHSSIGTNQTNLHNTTPTAIQTLALLASGELSTPTTPAASMITIDPVPEVPLRYRTMTDTYLAQLADDLARTSATNSITGQAEGGINP